MQTHSVFATVEADARVRGAFLEFSCPDLRGTRVDFWSCRATGLLEKGKKKQTFEDLAQDWTCEQSLVSFHA